MKGTAIVVIILAIFNLVSQAYAKGKMAKIQKMIDSLDVKIASMAAEQKAMSSLIIEMGDKTIMETGKKIESLEDQLRNFTKDNHCSRPEEELSCPPGWVFFRTSCYRFVDELLNWHGAVNNCEDMGGYLVEVDDEDEDKFIFDLFSKTGNTGYGPWMGGHDQKSEGNFVWQNSGKAVTYTNWTPGEPHLFLKFAEDCLHYSSIKGRGWNDLYCSSTAVSICERSK